MRRAKQGTAHAGRRGTARPEYHDGRLLGRKNWEDRQAIARRGTRVEQRPWNRKTKKRPARTWPFVCFLRPSHYPLPFDNMDISIWSEICQLFATFTWRGPVDLEFIDLFGGADA